MKAGDRVEIHYPAHWREQGVVTRIVTRDSSPSLVHILLDSKQGFVCDETMVKVIHE